MTPAFRKYSIAAAARELSLSVREVTRQMERFSKLCEPLTEKQKKRIERAKKLANKTTLSVESVL